MNQIVVKFGTVLGGVWIEIPDSHRTEFDGSERCFQFSDDRTIYAYHRDVVNADSPSDIFWTACALDPDRDFIFT